MRPGAARISRESLMLLNSDQTSSMPSSPADVQALLAARHCACGYSGSGDLRRESENRDPSTTRALAPKVSETKLGLVRAKLEGNHQQQISQACPRACWPSSDRKPRTWNNPYFRQDCRRAVWASNSPKLRKHCRRGRSDGPPDDNRDLKRQPSKPIRPRLQAKQTSTTSRAAGCRDPGHGPGGPRRPGPGRPGIHQPFPGLCRR